jgi:AcrR family transcriptional regulator
MNERDTKNRILDVAERLFAVDGFEATSLRDITAGAGVNLAAVNYHFQSKDSLIDAVIARRIEPINVQRLALLDRAGPNPTLEQILEAFLGPVFRIEMEELAPLVGRVLSNPDLFVERVFNRHLAAISQRFRAELARVLPELPAEELLWRLHFSVGVMTHTMLWGQIFPKITGGVCTLDDREALLRRAVQFLAAGFRAPASNELQLHA